MRSEHPVRGIMIEEMQMSRRDNRMLRVWVEMWLIFIWRIVARPIREIFCRQKVCEDSSQTGLLEGLVPLLVLQELQIIVPFTGKYDHSIDIALRAIPSTLDGAQVSREP